MTSACVATCKDKIRDSVIATVFFITLKTTNHLLVVKLYCKLHFPLRYIFLFLHFRLMAVLKDFEIAAFQATQLMFLGTQIHECFSLIKKYEKASHSRTGCYPALQK